MSDAKKHIILVSNEDRQDVENETKIRTKWLIRR